MIRAISTTITTLALVAGAFVIISGAAPKLAIYKLKKDGHTCQSSSYCKHTAGSDDARAKSSDARRRAF
jgi:hypothetical protein